MIAVGMPSQVRLAVALATVCAGLFPGAVHGAEPATHSLHIASQPLESALQEFARQTGVQVIFFSYLTDRKRSPALDGTYTVDAAMKALLAGSMLTCRQINAKTIEIRLLH
jgi:hypothetical protein